MSGASMKGKVFWSGQSLMVGRDNGMSSDYVLWTDGDLSAPSPEWAERIVTAVNCHDELVEASRAALEAIDDLIDESDGVYGLHRNGDVSPWDEINSGGRFGEWLDPVEQLRTALSSNTGVSDKGDGAKPLSPDTDAEGDNTKPSSSESAASLPSTDTEGK